ITAGFNSLSQLKLVNNPSISTYLTIGVILTGGAMLTTWMGDMITDRGIGNGVSIIIFAGIIARMPTSIYQIYQEQFVNVSQSDWWKSG
ncbi:hypothetical protein NL526_28295, partial [Klebsiella pneumoniae]|nr:hypothetical protein [Klebsiella pneumoniae]